MYNIPIKSRKIPRSFNHFIKQGVDKLFYYLFMFEILCFNSNMPLGTVRLTEERERNNYSSSRGDINVNFLPKR